MTSASPSSDFALKINIIKLKARRNQKNLPLRVLNQAFSRQKKMNFCRLIGEVLLHCGCCQNANEGPLYPRKATSHQLLPPPHTGRLINLSLPTPALQSNDLISNRIDFLSSVFASEARVIFPRLSFFNLFDRPRLGRVRPAAASPGEAGTRAHTWRLF